MNIMTRIYDLLLDIKLELTELEEQTGDLSPALFDKLDSVLQLLEEARRSK